MIFKHFFHKSNFLARAYVVYAITFSIISCESMSAKRKSPDPVKSVESDGIEYRAPLNASKMGVIEAWDIKSRELLWEKKIYKVRFKFWLEKDVQWVFISKLKIDNGRLVVTNENGDKYSLDLKDRKVEKIR